MKIGILGAGNVGGALGRIWASKGHDITFGVPDPFSTPNSFTISAEVVGVPTSTSKLLS